MDRGDRQMPALKMDGTVRKARKPKRTTKELPFWIEVQFSRAYQEGLAYFEGRKPAQPVYSTSPADVAGFAAGRVGMDSKQAFKALQEFAALHGFHRD